MGYKYKAECLETLQEFYDRYAEDCSNQVAVGSSLTITKCISTSTGVDVWAYKIDTGALVQSNSANIPHITPQTFSCNYTSPSSTTITTADIVETSWLIVGVWVVAWAVRKMIDAFWKH